MKADVMRQVARLVSTGGGGKFGQTQTLTQLDHRSTVSDEPTFHHRDLSIKMVEPGKAMPKPENPDQLKFGHAFADHMMEVKWTANDGWHRPAINPLHNLSLHPGAKVLHYATELFEGLKAYRGVDNKIRLFRPEMNMRRMRLTAARASLPTFDGEELIKIMCDLVNVDQGWVPFSSTASLYIRPTLIGTDPTLGVGHSNEALLYVLTGPVGAYYATGFKPVTLLADSQYIRAFPGGVGGYKMGCNYAPTILISRLAADLDCQQVLWLHGEQENITEVGTMNLFAFWINEQGEKELITPPLDGMILPGVTRQSLLDLARQWNEFKVSERNFSMADVKRAIKEKRMLEMFGAGTACVVSPVGRIRYKNHKKGGEYEDLLIPTIDNNPNLMKRFYDTIMDIQYGRTEQPGWTRVVDE